MAARSPVANVLILALVLLIGLAGVLFWQGSGLGDAGETPSTEGISKDPGAGTGTLKGEAGARPVASKNADRETIQPEAGGTGTKPKVELTGRLVRSDGSPGAGVALRFGSMRGLPRRLVGRANLANTTAVETDAEGRFRLMVQASALSFLALTDADVVFKNGNGIGRGMRVTVGKESKKLGDIPILQAARVSGRVVDSSGGPVAGVTVSSDRGGAMLALTLGEGNKTDADGRFQLKGLRPGEHQLATRSPEHLPQQHKVDLDEGQHLEDVLIQVKPGGFILGTVVDDLRKPVAGAEVVASRTQRIGVEIKITGFAPGESTRTDATGRFRLANLDTAKATLRVTKSGLSTQMARDVVVGTTDVVVEMKRLGAIEGVLVDEHNRPGQGSAVFASAARGGRMIRIADILPFSAQGTVTKDDGSFKIQNVAPGRVRVTARGDSHLPARKRVQVRPGETTTGVTTGWLAWCLPVAAGASPANGARCAWSTGSSGATTTTTDRCGCWVAAARWAGARPMPGARQPSAASPAARRWCLPRTRSWRWCDPRIWCFRNAARPTPSSTCVVVASCR